MKKLVVLALVLTAGVVFAQNRRQMMDAQDMPMRGRGMMGGHCGGMRGGMMNMSTQDEATMKQHMVDRGMEDADAAKMLQLRKEMSAIMQKYMK